MSIQQASYSDRSQSGALGTSVVLHNKGGLGVTVVSASFRVLPDSEPGDSSRVIMGLTAMAGSKVVVGSVPSGFPHDYSVSIGTLLLKDALVAEFAQFLDSAVLVCFGRNDKAVKLKRKRSHATSVSGKLYQIPEVIVSPDLVPGLSVPDTASFVAKALRTSLGDNFGCPDTFTASLLLNEWMRILHSCESGADLLKLASLYRRAVVEALCVTDARGVPKVTRVNEDGSVSAEGAVLAIEFRSGLTGGGAEVLDFFRSGASDLLTNVTSVAIGFGVSFEEQAPTYSSDGLTVWEAGEGPLLRAIKDGAVKTFGARFSATADLVPVVDVARVEEAKFVISDELTSDDLYVPTPSAFESKLMDADEHLKALGFTGTVQKVTEALTFDPSSHSAWPSTTMIGALTQAANLKGGLLAAANRGAIAVDDVPEWVEKVSLVKSESSLKVVSLKGSFTDVVNDLISIDSYTSLWNRVLALVPVPEDASDKLGFLRIGMTSIPTFEAPLSEVEGRLLMDGPQLTATGIFGDGLAAADLYRGVGGSLGTSLLDGSWMSGASSEGFIVPVTVESSSEGEPRKYVAAWKAAMTLGYAVPLSPCIAGVRYSVGALGSAADELYTALRAGLVASVEAGDIGDQVDLNESGVPWWLIASGALLAILAIYQVARQQPSTEKTFDSIDAKEGSALVKPSRKI